jgi:hypothetical protein
MEMRQAGPGPETRETRRDGDDMSERRQNVSETDQIYATVA